MNRFFPFFPLLALHCALALAAPSNVRGQSNEEVDKAPEALREDDPEKQPADAAEDQDNPAGGNKEADKTGKDEEDAGDSGDAGEPEPQPEEEIEVLPAGVRVVARQYGEGLKALRPFNWSRGTTLALLVTREEGGLIAFDEHASRLERFNDNLGNDLMASQEPAGRPFVAFSRVSPDGKATIPEVRAPGVPASGARSIEAKGTLVLRIATQKETFRDAKAPLKVGSKIKAGPVPLEIVEIGKPSYGDAALHLTLKAAEALDSLESVRFVDEKGREIPSRPAGAHRWSAFGKTHATRTFTLARPASEATIELTYWTDAREIEAPFRVTVPLGL